MGKCHIKRIVGRISDDVVEQYKLYDYRGIEIVQSLDLYSHVHKHIHEFKSVDSYNNAILNIDKIIANPYFVYYEKKRNSLHYFADRLGCFPEHSAPQLPEEELLLRDPVCRFGPFGL